MAATLDRMGYLKVLEQLALDRVQLVHYGEFPASQFNQHQTALRETFLDLNRNQRHTARRTRLQKTSTMEKKESIYKCNQCNSEVNPTECGGCKLRFTHCICAKPTSNHVPRHHQKHCLTCLETPENTDKEYTSFMDALKDVPSQLLFIRMLLPTLVDGPSKRESTIAALGSLHEHLKVFWRGSAEDRVGRMKELNLSPSIYFFLFGMAPDDITYPIDPERAEVVPQRASNSDYIRVPMVRALCKLSLRGPDPKEFVQHSLQSIYFMFHDEFSREDFDPNLFLQRLDIINPVLCMAFVMYMRVSRSRIPENANSSRHLWDETTNSVLNYDNVDLRSMKKLDAILVFYGIFFWVPSFSADALSPYVNESILRILRAEGMPTSKHFKATSKWKGAVFPITNDPSSLATALRSLPGYLPCDLPLSFVRGSFQHTQFLKVTHMFARLHASRFAMLRTPKRVDTTPEIRRLIVLLQLMATSPGKKFKLECEKMIRGTQLLLKTQTQLWECFLEKKLPSQDLLRRCLLMQSNCSMSKFQATQVSMLELNRKQKEARAAFRDVNPDSPDPEDGAAAEDVETALRGVEEEEEEEEDMEDVGGQEGEDSAPVFDSPELVSPPTSTTLTPAERELLRKEQVFKAKPEPFCETDLHRHAFLTSSDEGAEPKFTMAAAIARLSNNPPPKKRTCIS